MKSLPVLSTLSICAVASSALASFHEISISEVLTGHNGNTAVQYVELQMEGPGENLVSGHHLKSFDAAGTQIGDFTLTSNVAAGFQRKILLATQAFADLAVVTPDFILPANFLSPNSGQVFWSDGVLLEGRVSYGAYTGAGTNGTPASPNLNSDNKSLTRSGSTGNDSADFQSLDNTPMNNANATGHLSAPLTAAADWALYL